MSMFKMSYQAENLSQSLRRTVVGLTGLQKRLSFARPESFNFLGRGKFKSPLFVALAAILATQFPIADAQAQSTDTDCPTISGTRTTTVPMLGTDETCTVTSSGKVEAVGATDTNNRIVSGSRRTNAAGFRIEGARATVINRGLISGKSNRNDNRWGQGIAIAGNNAKVINYGTIKTANADAYGILIATGAQNPVLEFLGGQVYVDKTSSAIIETYSQHPDHNNNVVKLTLGGTLGKAGVRAQIYQTTARSKDLIILLPGAQVLGGGRFFTRFLEDVMKVGNFYDGDEPVGPRTGWVNFHGNLDFGKNYIYGTQPVLDSDELIINTNPGVRFASPNRHATVAGTEQNNENSAIYGLETLRIEKGELIFSGQINMLSGTGPPGQHGCESCTYGKVYIHDAGKLTFEIGKSSSNQMMISSLRAHQLIFMGQAPKVYIQFAHYLTAEEIVKFREQLAPPYSRYILRFNKVLYHPNPGSDREFDYALHSSTLKVMSVGSGGTRLVGYILIDPADRKRGYFSLYDDGPRLIGKTRFSPRSTSGTAPVARITPSTPSDDDGDTGDGDTGDGDTGDGDTGDGDNGDGDNGDGDNGDGDTGGTPDASTGTGGSGGGGAGGIMAVGLLALLMNYGQDLDETESELGQYFAFDTRSAKNRSRRSSAFSGLLGTDRGMWVRPAQSRFTSYGSSYFGAVSHRMSWDLQQSGDYFLRASLSPGSSVSPTGWHSSASGETVSLTGGWQGEGQRLQLSFTHGRYDAKAKLYDSTTRGNLFGDSTFRHTSVHASAVQELSGGPMKMSASASLMAGQVEQAAYAAENAVIRAKVPAYRQSYAGTRLGFSAKSRKWLALSDAVSVKPHLKISMMRTRSSASDPVLLRQSDKVGALSFETATVLQGVPKSLNVLGIGTDVKPSGLRGAWRLGYAGMEVDGEYQHAAVAAYQMRF